MPRLFIIAGLALCPLFAAAEFKAGAARIDITPDTFPAIVNGGFLQRSTTNVHTRLHARSICLHDGKEQLAIVVVDSCMVPRTLCDEAKALAKAQTGIATDRMLICATHTHSAPAAMGCLGCDLDPNYVPLLRRKLVEAVVAAQKNLEPARAGIAVVQAPEHTALRRWIRRPDRIALDPFGNPTMRANMHAANNWDNVTGESGPEDPDLSVISFQATDGRPLAVFANFSMHYFSDKALSADYFGLFSEEIKRQLAPDTPAGKAPFVGMMSHGCSGDIWRRDYRKPPGERGEKVKIGDYANELADMAVEALEGITYREDITLAMAETRLPLNYRVPDAQRLKWAKDILEDMGERLPKNQTEVLAREAVILHERQSTEVVVQALRIGDFGIATTPNETYALTGLKIKLLSPLKPCVVLDLANGGDGYIPPPEQHVLGGYNTWPARTAGLEVQAEPKITEAAVTLLEQVSGRARYGLVPVSGPACTRIAGTGPVAYWRFEEYEGPIARDRSRHHRAGFFEDGVVFWLEGPHSEAFHKPGRINRCAHFCGGRMRAPVTGLGDSYSVSLWFWNGMPDGAREVAGWMFAGGRPHSAYGDRIGLDGEGRLIFQAKQGPVFTGKTACARWTWHNAVLCRLGEDFKLYLDGKLELEGKAKNGPHFFEEVFVGGRADGVDNWEGRLDEVAVFGHELSIEEVEAMWKASQR